MTAKDFMGLGEKHFTISRYYWKGNWKNSEQWYIGNIYMIKSKEKPAVKQRNQGLEEYLKWIKRDWEE